MLVRATTPTMDHFLRHVTRVWKFGYYSVNPAWEGNIFNLMYCVYGKIRQCTTLLHVAPRLYQPRTKG